ncbi:MAG: 7-carboxy-7-deazaguanine synthase QueE [Candidatus Omnitrophota bacterium]
MSEILRAPVSEIFSSIQGEGIHAGERHLFVRFVGCNLECSYCDERGKKGVSLAVEDVLAEVERLEKASGPHSFVSLTGGEPLIQASFLSGLLPRLRDAGFRNYLETNGTFWREIARIGPWCDCIAMDLKPASVTHTQDCAQDHFQFLAEAKGRDLFVKMAVSEEIDMTEFENLIKMMAHVVREAPLVLMPVTAPGRAAPPRKTWDLLYRLQGIALRTLPDVRILPRLHELFHLR